MPRIKTNFEIRTTTAEIVHQGRSMIVAVNWRYTIIGTPVIDCVFDGKKDITGEMDSDSYTRCVKAMHAASKSEQERRATA